jgi:hypothetical protein
VTTTTETYHLRAVTDRLAARTHLGATERANLTWCGVPLLVKGDTRFGGRYKNGDGYTASTDLSVIDCGACKRTAAWKGRKGSTWTAPAPKARAAAANGAATAGEAGR